MHESLCQRFLDFVGIRVVDNPNPSANLSSHLSRPQWTSQASTFFGAPVGVPTGCPENREPVVVPGCDGRCGVARNVLAQGDPPLQEFGSRLKHREVKLLLVAEVGECGIECSYSYSYMCAVNLTARRLLSYMQNMRRERRTPVGLQPTKESCLPILEELSPGAASHSAKGLRQSLQKELSKHHGLRTHLLRNDDQAKLSYFQRKYPRLWQPMALVKHFPNQQYEPHELLSTQKALYQVSKTLLRIARYISTESDKGLNDALLLSATLAFFPASVGSMASAGLKRIPWTPESC